MKKIFSIIIILIIVCVSTNLSIAQVTVFSQNFDGAWTNAGSLSPAWTGVGTGNNEWHKDNYTTGWTSATGAYTPTGALSTSNSARFHTYDAASGTTGSIATPNIDLSAYSTGSTISFYMINTSGTDVLNVAFSNDGGSTYTSQGTMATAAAWTQYSFYVGPSFWVSNFRVKFTATSDYGTTDIGLDQLIVTGCSTCTNFNMGNGSTGTCSGNFYDSGGSAGNAGNNENYTLTFYPTTVGNMVVAAFSSFSTDNTWDYLYIYNGNSTAAPLIGTYTGTTSPGTVTSCAFDGSLTFRFTSDASAPSAGWAATMSCIAPSGSKTWITTGTTAWTTASNWSPAGAPSICDNVVIPSGGTQPTISAANVAICNNLTINSGAILTAAITTGSFNIYGNVINNGTLNHTGTTLINLNGVGNTIGGSGTSTNAKLNFNNGCNYTLSSNLTIYNLRISYASATSYGTVNLGSYTFEITNTITQNGFINLNTGVFRDKIFAQTLTMNRFNHNSGTWWWDLTGQASGGQFNLIDNDFYSLRFTCDPTYTISLGEIGMTDVTLGGSLTIDPNTTFSDFTLGYTVVPINLKGTWTNNGNFTANTTAPALTGSVTFNGTTPQLITGSSSTTFSNLVINNTSSTGVTLNAPANVMTGLTLTDGNIFSSSTNLLTILNGGTSTAGSAASFVDGPMKKIGTTAFVFPVGDNTIWARIGMSAETGVTAVTDAFTAEYFDAAYATLTPVAAPNAYVSSVEHWIFNRTVGTLNNTSVTLYWENGTRSGINTFTSDLHVARWDGSIWQDHGSGTMTGSAAAGSIQTSAAVTNFSPFTFASISASLATNPLPIELLYFTGDCNTNNTVLKWSTATEINNDFFTLERSIDGIYFEPIAIVDGAGNSTNYKNYSYVDDNITSEKNYYRLKQTDFNGQYNHSNSLAVNCNGNGEPTFSLFPNPTSTDFTFDCSSAEVDIMVYDFTGKLIDQYKNVNSIFHFGKEYAKGIYFVNAVSGSKTKTYKAIKQ